MVPGAILDGVVYGPAGEEINFSVTIFDPQMQEADIIARDISDFLNEYVKGPEAPPPVMEVADIEMGSLEDFVERLLADLDDQFDSGYGWEV